MEVRPPLLLLLLRIVLRLAIDDLVHYLHQLMWSVGHDIYTIQLKKTKYCNIFLLFLLLV